MRQFETFEILDIIESALETNGLSPEDLQIEITESIFYANIRTIRTIIGEIRRIGVTIGIDDFGTGYSSLALLSKLPIDFLKIDKTFVDELGGPDRKEMVSAILSISRNLDLKSIIEGVETREQLDILSSYGPLVVQGYYFSKPVAPDDFIAYFRGFDHGGKIPGPGRLQ